MRPAPLLLAAFACATAPPPAPTGPSPADYVPLEVGYRWTYAMRFPGQTGERTVTIVGQDDDGFFVDDAGGAFALTPDGLRDRDRYLLMAPLVVGRSWRSVVSASAVERYEVKSVGDACEVRAGKFPDCVVIESRLRRDSEVSLRVRFTWARGVGLVKVATVAEISGRGDVPQTEQSLLRYELVAGARPAGPEPEAEEPPDTWGR